MVFRRWKDIKTTIQILICNLDLILVVSFCTQLLLKYQNWLKLAYLQQSTSSILILEMQFWNFWCFQNHSSRKKLCILHLFPMLKKMINVSSWFWQRIVHWVSSVVIYGHLFGLMLIQNLILNAGLRYSNRRSQNTAGCYIMIILNFSRLDEHLFISSLVVEVFAETILCLKCANKKLMLI